MSKLPPCPSRSRLDVTPQRSWICVAAAVFATTALLGCQTPWNLSSLKIPFTGTMASAGEPSDLQISQIGGPLHRMAAKITRDRKYRNDAIDKSKLAAEFAAAEDLYQAADYAEAEKAFKEIVHAGESLLTRLKPGKKAHVRGHPYREDALFYVAECQYHRNRYAWAQDSYARLMQEYPSTQYMDRTTRRLFQIARSWLGVEGFQAEGAIQQVGLEDATDAPPPKKLRGVQAWPIVPNVTDRERPVFDTEGRAIQALKSIWLNDPTGPLADDALMLSATYRLRKGQWSEADHLFGILRDEYPKSPHLQDAYLLGSHVKLMAYQGADYDDKRLLEAEELKRASLRLFPDSAERERLTQEVRKIQDAKAQRDWQRVEFYLRKKRPQAVAVYCNLILEEHPDSPYASKARELLESIQSTIGQVRIRDTDRLTPLQEIPRLRSPFSGNSSIHSPDEAPDAGTPGKVDISG